MSSSELFDLGLQPERTLLAWRRTVLSLAVGIAVIVRLAAPDLGHWVLVLGGCGVVVVLVAWQVATVRYRRTHTSLTGPPGPLIVGGSTITVVAAVAVMATGLAAIWAVVTIVR